MAGRNSESGTKVTTTSAPEPPKQIAISWEGWRVPQRKQEREPKEEKMAPGEERKGHKGRERASKGEGEASKR